MSVSADALNMIDPDELDLCSIVWTVASYVVANLEDQLPREGDYPTKEPPTGGSAVCIPSAVSIMAVAVILLMKHINI